MMWREQPVWSIFKPSDPELEGRLGALEAPRPSEGLRDRLYAVPQTAGLARSSRPAARRRVVAVFAGCCAAAVLLFARVDRSGPVMADVVRSLGDVQTATWVETRRTFALNQSEPSESSSEMWVRMNPPALARRNPNGFRSLIDSRGQLVYKPKPQDQYSLGETVGKVSRQMVTSAIAVPSEGQASLLGPGWKRSSVTEGGRSYTEFRRERETGSPPVRTTQGVRVDPATLQVVRSESRQSFPGSTQIQFEVVSHDYRYNTPPPAETFDWSPHPGMRVVAEDYTSFGEPPVPAGELRAMETVIRRSEAGWAKGDWELFASAWDFAALDRFPLVKPGPEQRREIWRVRLENHAIYRPWRSVESRTKFAAAQHYLIPYGSIPRSEPGITMVVTTTRVAWGEGQSDEVTGHYYLTKNPDGYRILLWDQPDPAPYIRHRRPRADTLP